MEKQALKALMLKEIDDMVAYYEVNPDARRAKMGDECAYLVVETGSKCAIGRMLNEDDLKMLKEDHMLFDTTIFDIYEILTTERIKALPLSFLAQLQEVHDNDTFWNAEGLTNIGRTAINTIKIDVDEGMYSFPLTNH
jgi:hypothetical protein